MVSTYGSQITADSRKAPESPDHSGLTNINFPSLYCTLMTLQLLISQHEKTRKADTLKVNADFVLIAFQSIEESC